MDKAENITAKIATDAKLFSDFLRDFSPLIILVQFVIIPTHRIFINITDVFFIIFSASNNMIVVSALPNVISKFLIAKSFES